MQTTESACSLCGPKVRAVLERAYQNARGEWFRLGPYMVLDKLLRRTPSIKEYVRRTKKMYIPLSRERGTFAYLLARSINAQRIVEFGTAFGISTIYLAAAVKDNGGGIVIGSEIEDSKVTKAQTHLEEAGLAGYVEIRRGDARMTLAEPGGKVDMLLVDGYKEIYVAIVTILMPHLRPGSVVLGDNVSTPIIKKSLASYVAFMNDPKNGFYSVTVPFWGGIEYSVRL